MGDVVKKAYDYHIITSPFSVDELEMRVRAAMQQGYEPIGGVTNRGVGNPQWAQASCEIRLHQGVRQEIASICLNKLQKTFVINQERAFENKGSFLILGLVAK